MTGSASPLFRRAAFIGIGLIGSSLVRAMRRHGALAGEIVAFDQSEAVRARVAELDLVDRVCASAAEAVTGADLVVLCVPLGAYRAVGEAIAPALAEGVIVTDIGSTKRMVLDVLGPLLPATAQLVPGHPVAGTEKSGPEAGFASMFENRYCILTPAPEADAAAVDAIAALWRGVGAIVEMMDADHHDRVLAVTSHLPHLIAYTIVGTAADLESQLAREQAENGSLIRTHEVIRFSAGGFRDFTRIAGSNPVMWRDIFLNNRGAVLEMLGRFTEDLVALQRAIRFGEGEVLYDWFARTREIRRGVIEMGQAGSFNPLETEAAAPGATSPATEQAAAPAGSADAPTGQAAGARQGR